MACFWTAFVATKIFMVLLDSRPTTITPSNRMSNPGIHGTQEVLLSQYQHAIPQEFPIKNLPVDIQLSPSLRGKDAADEESDSG